MNFSYIINFNYIQFSFYAFKGIKLIIYSCPPGTQSARADLQSACCNSLIHCFLFIIL
jgi:hypothetical protein